MNGFYIHSIFYWLAVHKKVTLTLEFIESLNPALSHLLSQTWGIVQWPWSQEDGIKCKPIVRFIEEYKGLCDLICHARITLTQSYNIILGASLWGPGSLKYVSQSLTKMRNKVTVASPCCTWLQVTVAPDFSPPCST